MVRHQSGEDVPRRRRKKKISLARKQTGYADDLQTDTYISVFALYHSLVWFVLFTMPLNRD